MINNRLSGRKGVNALQRVSRYCITFFLAIIWLLLPNTVFSAGSFSVKRVGNLIPFNDNAFTVTAPENGELEISIHDDISVYRVIRQEIEAGDTTIHWDGCAFNHEKLAAKNYTISAELKGISGEEYSISFNTPVEYTGQCLQYLLPSSNLVALENPEEWFVEFRTVQKGTVVFLFENSEKENGQTAYTANTTGGRINRLTFTELTGKSLSTGNYHVTAYEKTKPEETFEFDLNVLDRSPSEKEVFLTGEILPEAGMTESQIWQYMQQPSVVVDIDPFKHQKVYSEKSRESDSLGTLHGQTQALKVMKLEDEWAFIGAWNHEEAEYMEGWVPSALLKVVEPDPDYGLLINKQMQTMDVFYRGKRIDTLAVSTGRPEPKHPEQETAAGSFLTGYHRVDFSTNGKKYDYVIQYDGGNLLHQIPYEWGKDKKDFSLGRGYLGAKASHACIRIQSEPGENGINAYWIWTHIPYRTRVLILDDPDERRPVTEGPEIIREPLKTTAEQFRIIIMDEKWDEEASPSTAIAEADGHRIGFAGCSEKEYLRDPETVTLRIRELQEKGCEKTILRCFWTDHKAERHTAIQEAMARKGIKAGADLVVGNGNRTFLGCEGFEKGMILYGLGDGNIQRGGKQQATSVLTAEIIFDSSLEKSRPIIVLCPADSGADTEMIAEQLAEDSIGTGIRQVYLLKENQSKQ